MRTLFSLMIVLAGTSALLSQDQPAAAPDSIKVDVPLVSLDVTVVDSQGRSIMDLNRSDFSILEDGAPQPIRNFSSVKAPYSVLLLLDCSESTRDRMTLLLDGMVRFVDQLRTSDNVAVAAFGSDVHTILDWSPERKRKINFGDSPICRSTDFYGAIDWSVRKIHGMTGRRGVVVFSDGFHTDVARKDMLVNGNRVRRVVPPAEDRDFQRILKRVRESGATFYFVAVDTDRNPGREYAGPIPDLQQIRARMELLADASGGRIVFPKETSDVVPLFLQIGRELGTAYSLAYTPSHPKDGNYHSIEIRVRGEGYQVQQSRKGYTGN